MLPRTLYTAIRSRLLDPGISRWRLYVGGRFTSKTFRRVSHGGYSFDILLDPSNGLVDCGIYVSGVHEPDILNLFIKYIPKGGVFVDVGANIGHHSLFAAAVTGNAGKVISFEPIPKIANQFKESIYRNKYEQIVDLHNVACGDIPKQATLHLLEGNIGGSSIVPGVGNYSKEINVPVIRLDDELASINHIDMIKIDTEGFEKQVFDGLKDSIAKHRPVIIFEYSPIAWADDAQKIGHHIFLLIAKNKYRFYDLEDRHTEIKNIENWVHNFTYTQTNILCIPV